MKNWTLVALAVGLFSGFMAGAQPAGSVPAPVSVNGEWDFYDGIKACVISAPTGCPLTVSAADAGFNNITVKVISATSVTLPDGGTLIAGISPCTVSANGDLYCPGDGGFTGGVIIQEKSSASIFPDLQGLVIRYPGHFGWQLAQTNDVLDLCVGGGSPVSGACAQQWDLNTGNITLNDLGFATSIFTSTVMDNRFTNSVTVSGDAGVVKNLNVAGTLSLTGNVTNATHRGTIVMSGGTGTATVASGAICVCSVDTAFLACQPSVSSTTLTVTVTGGGSNTVSYICL